MARKRRRRRRPAIRWGMIAAVLLAVLAGAWAWNFFQDTYPEPDGVEFTVTFQDPGRLSEGRPVRSAGEVVGLVRGIDPDPGTDDWAVRIRLYEGMEDEVAGPPDATARIVTRGWVFRRAHVEMIQPGGVATPVAQDDVLEGLESWAAEQAFRARVLAERGFRQVREATQALRERALAEADAVQEQVRDWAEGPEGEALRRRMDDFRREVSRATGEGADQAREASQRAVEQGLELIESLRRQGREDLADRIRETVGMLEESDEQPPPEEPAEPDTGEED